MKRINIIGLLGCCLLTFSAGLMSCSDWTDAEPIGQNVERPQEQDPALWAKYTAALREYKQSEHFLIYARLHNSPRTGDQ